MQLSDRLKGLVQSDIRRMSRECERVGGINLGQGICDLPTHPLVAQGAITAIENNWADRTQDSIINEDNRRYAALALLLRARFLVDVDSYTESRGRPITPGRICNAIRPKLTADRGKAA